MNLIFVLIIFLLISGCQTYHRAAEYNVQLGMAYLKQENYERAKEKFLKALAQDAKSPNVLSAIAFFSEKTGDIENAQKYYLKALQSDAHNAQVQNNYGTYLCRQKHYEEAEEYFLKAAMQSEYVHTADAFENAGLCALTEENTQKAEDYFNKALLQDPLRFTSNLEMSRLKCQQKNWKEANTYFQRLNSTQMNKETLQLGIQIAHNLGDTSKKNLP